jgi:ubiquinone/menaquinone biosynthesis C-methylase UbiE
MNDHKHVHGGFSTQGSFDPLLIFDLLKLQKGSKVLDAGCGDGYLSLIASRMVGEEGKVYSYDVHEQSIFILKKRIEHGRSRNIEADVVDLLLPIPVENHSLDLILFSNVLHGIIFNNEVEPILEMIRSKLKKKGRIAIVEFVKEETGMGPPIEERISPGDIEKHLGKISFRMEDVFRVSDHHYLAIFSNKDTG